MSEFETKSIFVDDTEVRQFSDELQKLREENKRLRILKDDADIVVGIFRDYFNSMVEFKALEKAISFLEKDLETLKKEQG